MIGPVTTDRPDPTASTAHTATRPLRRRGSDRVIGGVAAGIADYFNVDPLLIRAAFVGLMIFGGAGLVLYVGAWLLIPVEGQDDSVVESVLRRTGMASGRAILIVAIALFIFWLVVAQGGVWPQEFQVNSTLAVVVLVIVGVVLLRRGERSRSNATVAEVAPDAAPALPAPRTEQRVARPPVPRGPLGWYTLAGALLGIGLLALLDNASDATVHPGQFFGLALAIVGIGLVIGAWWGNARLLILPALLVLPIAWASSYVTVPLEGGTGDHVFAPVTAQELEDEYRMIGGRMTLDLRGLEAGNEPIRISASVAFGTLTVLLPTEARLEIESRVGAGGSHILEGYQTGTDVTDRYVRGESGPRFVLDLGTGIGYVWVEEYER